MADLQISEKMKCLIADEVKCAIENENRTIEDSKYKEYLYEILVTNDPFNQYYEKYDKAKKISIKVCILIAASLVLLSYIWSVVDSEMDFLRTAVELIIFMIFVMSFIGVIISLFEKKKAMKHYIPIIKKNIDRLEYELKISTIIQERRNYIAVLHNLCSYIYSNDKYTFKHYKC
ncbi:hypothetical protein [Clostridium peptidivorans]|uniref:hypothetical protein n=1 Tax=Clostridium peptidivorans TaxID=100174 RepID=UPI000BE3F8DB|nr:hypothetical protein [Clostridium peptidivorans]